MVHENIKALECESCHKNFGKIDLFKHVKTVHEKIKAFKCESCGKSFGLKGGLETHITTIHGKIKPYTC